MSLKPEQVVKHNMFTSETKIRVRYVETDSMGFVYHGNYFPYFESARAEAIRTLGFTYADIEKMGVIMPVTDLQCRFIRPALYDDLLTVKTSLSELPVHEKISFHHEVLNESNQLLAKAKVVLIFMERKTMKPRLIPDELLKKFQPYFS